MSAFLSQHCCLLQLKNISVRKAPRSLPSSFSRPLSTITIANSRPHSVSRNLERHTAATYNAFKTSFDPASHIFSAASFLSVTKARLFQSSCVSRMAAEADVNSRSAVPPERLAEDLERPALDNRSYRVIRLPNKLEALLIHDPDTDKVSAALDVNVGSFSDAEDMPGMAHAVEHLLFMGTKKYPKENDYNLYLTAHSGYSNAFTASTSTNYFFEVAASAEDGKGQGKVQSNKGESSFYGALDRFAQFFIAPLFLEETLDRELKAVDSENKKNLQSDGWRLRQLNKSLSNPNHPFCHFSTGSYQTLHNDPIKRGVAIRDEFIRFYEKHYSANLMKLVILGREGLDTLESWTEELFSPIVNKDLPRNRWDDISPYTERELATQIFAKPVFDVRTLDISFPYRDEEELYESQPGGYLSHLIGHEGPGSILAYLKAKGWATELGAGQDPVCPGTAFFGVSIRMTEEGLKQYKEIIKVVFQYIAMLRDTPPQKWIIDELIKMSEVNFKYKQKRPASKTTSSLSGRMQMPYPRERLLSGPSLIRKFDPESIKEGLACLQPNNFRYTLVSQQYPGVWKKKEKWYGTDYDYESIPTEMMAEIEAAFNLPAESRPRDLHMPNANEFIPERLDVERKEVVEPSKAPVLVRNDDGIRLWHKKDDRFWVPKANVHIILRSPVAGITPRATVMTELFCELIQDSLVEYAYAAELAGLSYDLQSLSLGLSLSVHGYNDKMSVLLAKLMDTVRKAEVRDDRFLIVKERLARSFRNFEYQPPYNQIGTYSRWLGSERAWINAELQKELQTITAEEIRGFVPQFLAQLHMEVLAHGNLHKEDALKMTDMVASKLNSHALPPSQWRSRRTLVVPNGSNYIYSRKLEDPENVNHCIEYMLYIGNNQDRVARAKVLLLAQISSEPCFDQLRTKEQLGYVVFSGSSIHNTWLSFRLLIQSERPPEYLEERIEAFLFQLQKEIEEMSSEEFEKHKKSLINKRLESPKYLNAETTRFLSHILSENYDFEQGKPCLHTL